MNMKTTICYIDDKIPVNQFPEYFEESGLIEQSILSFLLKNDKTDWSEDINVKGVIELLMKGNEYWTINAFTTPSFFINYRENESYINPDIILYDWDYNYPAGSNSSKDYLLQILKTSYSIITIYSGADNYYEIIEVLKDDDLNLYKDRLDVIEKSTEDSISKVIEKTKIRFNSNFSYQYGKKLLHESNRTLNEILSEISSLSIEQFIASFGCLKYNKYRLDSDELASIIFEKYKQKLIEGVGSIELPINKTQEITDDVVKKIWSYRLYYTSSNKNVKQGDIVKDADNYLFFVFSSDCHIDKFWNKNYGYLSLIPLYQMEKGGVSKDLFGVLKKANSFSISSLVNPRSIDDVTILPAIPHDGKYSNYLLFPKGIFTVKIEAPVIDKVELKEVKRNYSLEYSYLPEYDRIVSISETFKHPLIQFIQNNITGYGCPDFPDKLQDYLKNEFKESLV